MNIKFQEVQLEDCIAITLLGIGLVAAILKGFTEIALALGGALGGYAGAVINKDRM